MPRLPSAPPPDSLLLFVAGEPESTPGVRESGVGVVPRLGSMLLFTGVLPKNLQPGYAAGHGTTDGFEPPPLTDSRRWHLPPLQMACLEMVLEAAERQRRTVLVVDVDRPAEQRDLVDRWVGPNDVLPLLVRPDGARLDGAENFVPTKVRRFIAGR